MLKIRRPLGRLIFNMGIAIPGKTVFLIETAPRDLSRILYQRLLSVRVFWNILIEICCSAYTAPTHCIIIESYIMIYEIRQLPLVNLHRPWIKMYFGKVRNWNLSCYLYQVNSCLLYTFSTIYGMNNIWLTPLICIIIQLNWNSLLYQLPPT